MTVTVQAGLSCNPCEDNVHVGHAVVSLTASLCDATWPNNHATNTICVKLLLCYVYCSLLCCIQRTNKQNTNKKHSSPDIKLIKLLNMCSVMFYTALNMFCGPLWLGLQLPWCVATQAPLIEQVIWPGARQQPLAACSSLMKVSDWKLGHI